MPAACACGPSSKASPSCGGTQSARSHMHLAIDTATGRTVSSTQTRSIGATDSATTSTASCWRNGSPAGWTAPRHQGLARRRPRPPLRGDGIHRRPDPRPVDGRQPEPSLASVRTIVEHRPGPAGLHRRRCCAGPAPENVMIDGRGTVKLIDLATVHVAGLRRDAGLRRRRPGARRAAVRGPGIPARPVWRQPASDLFSLAVVTYRMLGGQLPYRLDLARATTARPPATAAHFLRHHRPDCRRGWTRCSARPAAPTRRGARR